MLKNIKSAPNKANAADPKVRLIHPSPRGPATAVERSVVATLNNVDTLSLSSLVERVARDLYREEVAMGAGILDIGLFGPNLFIRDVAAELSAGNGILWSIETSR
ncbi:MAG: hypothetical protein ACREQ2_20930 [Candidatus Binatia bacterium]